MWQGGAEAPEATEGAGPVATATGARGAGGTGGAAGGRLSPSLRARDQQPARILLPPSLPLPLTNQDEAEDGQGHARAEPAHCLASRPREASEVAVLWPGSRFAPGPRYGSEDSARPWRGERGRALRPDSLTLQKEGTAPEWFQSGRCSVFQA